MRDKIKDIMKSVFELNIINDEISSESCDKWDSISFLNLVVSLESEFEIDFEPEDLSEMNSLNNIERKIKNLIE